MVIGLETIDSYINAFKIKYNYLDKLFNGKLFDLIFFFYLTSVFLFYIH